MPTWSIPTQATPLPPPLARRDRLFGRDVRFRNDFTITPAGDWATEEGWNNLRMSLYRRMMTSPGEFRHRPTYGAGVRAALHERASQSNLEELAARIADQCRLDDRVQDVEVTAGVEEINGQEVTVIRLRATAFGETKHLEPFQVFYGNKG